MLCIYHIPRASVAADTLRAALAGLACGAVLAWASCSPGRADGTGQGATAGDGHKETGRKHVPPAVVLGLAVCALAGCAANALAETSWSWPGTGAFGILALSCLGTAAWEETLFRRLLPAAVVPQLDAGRHRELACACICAGLFSLLHLDASLGVVGTAARFIQVALFGLVMAGVARRRGGLAWAVALHAGYDLVSFVWGAGTAVGAGTGLETTADVPGLLDMPAETLLAGVVSPAGLAVGIVALAPLAVWAVRELTRTRP